MTHRLSPKTPRRLANPLPATTPQPWRDRLPPWLARTRAALLRAERRITANFRVPPHGG